MEAMGEEAAFSRLLGEVCRGRDLTGEEQALVRRRAAEDPAADALRSQDLKPAASVAERMGMFRRLCRFCPSVELEAAGHPVTAELSLVELWRFYLPICRMVQRVGQGAGRRVLVGVTGPGASGKTVFSLLLSRLLNESDEAEPAAVCPMDGFHYPNAYLESHYTTDAAGERVSLRSVKGSPPSFDVDSFVDTLRRLRSQDRVTAPRYDRGIHDPVPDGIGIEPRHRTVVVEGNYLLLADGRWSEVRALLDLCFFLYLLLPEARKAMIERHVAGGRSPDEAREYYERVDRGNYLTIMQTAHRADLIVERTRAHITGLHRPASFEPGRSV